LLSPFLIAVSRFPGISFVYRGSAAQGLSSAIDEGEDAASARIINGW